MDASVVIVRARQRAGLTQQELADRAGTSQPVISAYEHGRRDPSITTLGKLVAAAGARLEVSSAPVSGDLPPAVDDQERAQRLVDLLLLADATHHRRTGPLSMPRMTSR